MNWLTVGKLIPDHSYTADFITAGTVTWAEIDTESEWDSYASLDDWEIPHVVFVEAKLPGNRWFYPPSVSEHLGPGEDDLVYKDLSGEDVIPADATANLGIQVPVTNATTQTSTVQTAITMPVQTNSSATLGIQIPITNIATQANTTQTATIMPTQTMHTVVPAPALFQGFWASLMDGLAFW